MLIYLFTFICCFLADYFKQRNAIVYKILVIWVYVFLCFGYMTGSDWRGYEMSYYYTLDLSKYKEAEYGFVWLVNICKLFISDFWIFSALCKTFYLYTLLKLLKQFTEYNWSALGITFTTSTLFMLIDCPMRFMLGSSFIYLAFVYYIQNKKSKAILFSLIASVFHITMLLLVIIGLLSFASKWFVKFNKFWMILILLFVYVLITFTGFYEMIYNYFLPILGYEKYLEWERYRNFDILNIFSIGRIKELIIFCMILMFKDKLLSLKYGNIIYFYGTTAILLTPILEAIPTAFRIGIFPSLFTVIAIIHILNSTNILTRFRPIIRYSFYCLFAFLLLRNVYGSYKYLPYSNSIPYILTTHLPYGERELHNIIEYTKITGKPAE